MRTVSDLGKGKNTTEKSRFYPIIADRLTDRYQEERRVITKGLLWRKSRLDEVKPEHNLVELYVGRVTLTDHNDVDAVGITNKQVVRHVIRLVARELPQAYLADTCTTVLID